MAAEVPTTTKLTGTLGLCTVAPESPTHRLSTTWPEGSQATAWHVISEARMQRVDKNLTDSCLARGSSTSRKWDNKINCNYVYQALL